MDGAAGLLPRRCPRDGQRGAAGARGTPPSGQASAADCVQLAELLVGELDLRRRHVVFQVADIRVPGIGNMTGERRRSQASASCDGETPFFSASP